MCSSFNRRKAGSMMKIYGVMIIVLLSVFGFVCATELDQKDSIETTRSVIERWVETQRLISKEKHDWALAQENLNNRIDMIKTEVDSINEKIIKGWKDVNEADVSKTELFEENEQLKNASEELGQIITILESKTLSLNSKLPETIKSSDRIKLLCLRIPNDPNESKLSLSQRFMSVIGILNELNKFNHEITVTSEVQQINDGSSIEVTSMYIGLGQAYYVNANGTKAGVGRPSANGWSWESKDETARDISDAISILKSEKVASFVPLPVKVE